jgi:hypothetical protein
VTVLADLMVRVQDVPELESQPSHPLKTERSPVGVAVRVTTVP